MEMLGLATHVDPLSQSMIKSFYRTDDEFNPRLSPRFADIKLVMEDAEIDNSKHASG